MGNKKKKVCECVHRLEDLFVACGGEGIRVKGKWFGDQSVEKFESPNWISLKSIYKAINHEARKKENLITLKDLFHLKTFFWEIKLLSRFCFSALITKIHVRKCNFTWNWFDLSTRKISSLGREIYFIQLLLFMPLFEFSWDFLKWTITLLRLEIVLLCL